uniref:Heparan-alpha-glucosaminide N-acetyltransferase-like n=1 Tax=Nelumbo nucifera TaxID=4432 RepID=A0A822YGI2_NELNU|nr:TPA_asm: hypothetical protein HUJ06_012155 [Nelumbo nucifera]
MSGDTSHQHRLMIEEAEKPEISNEKTQTAKRVASLDIFRGLTVAMMILVDDAGREWQMIGHAPWNGCNLTDFVMPFFLFIVGVAIALALKRIPSPLKAIRKVILITLKLLFWGLILGYPHASDKLTYGVYMKKIRWCGILLRIVLAYLVVALLEISTKRAQADDLLSGAPYSSYTIGNVYLAILYGTYVPNWHFTVHNKDYPDYGKVFTVTCGLRGSLDPPCNAVGYINRKVLGINHMYQHLAWRRSKVYAPSWCQAPFEPKGVLSSVSSILTTILGVHLGHVLIHVNSHWIFMGLTFLILGIFLHFTNAIPLNKQLYNFNYVCLTAGAAGLVFSVFYIMVDILGFQYLFLPLEWIGINAMLVFVMAVEGIFVGFINGVVALFSIYYVLIITNKSTEHVYWIQKHIFIRVWHSRRVGIILYVIFAEILF